jgi:hypothetical protein
MVEPRLSIGIADAPLIPSPALTAAAASVSLSLGIVSSIEPKRKRSKRNKVAREKAKKQSQTRPYRAAQADEVIE